MSAQKPRIMTRDNSSAAKPRISRGCRRSRQTIHRSEEHTSELQSPCNFVCRLLLEKKPGSRRADPNASAEVTVDGPAAPWSAVEACLVILQLRAARIFRQTTRLFFLNANGARRHPHFPPPRRSSD